MKCRRTRLNSEVSYSGKDSICRKTHDKKKEEVKPKISGEKNVSRKVFRVFETLGGLVDEYPLRTKAVLSIFKVKIYSGTDNLKTTLRQFGRYMYLIPNLFTKERGEKSFCFLHSNNVIETKE